MTEWSADATAYDEGLSVTRLEGHNTMILQAQPQHLQEPVQNGDHGQHASHHGIPMRSGRGFRRSRSIVVRIEVHDTGVGIKPRDMIDNRVSVGIYHRGVNAVDI